MKLWELVCFRLCWLPLNISKGFILEPEWHWGDFPTVLPTVPGVVFDGKGSQWYLITFMLVLRVFLFWSDLRSLKVKVQELKLIITYKNSETISGNAFTILTVGIKYEFLNDCAFIIHISALWSWIHWFWIHVSRHFSFLTLY